MDARLRDAERFWQADPSPKAEVSLLLERLRAGQLHRQQVQLAAYCGHQAALSIVGPDVPSPDAIDKPHVPGISAWRRPLEGWARGLVRHWPEALLRVPLGPACRALALHRDSSRYELAAVTLAALESWALTGSESDREKVIQANESLRMLSMQIALRQLSERGENGSLSPDEVRDSHAIDSVQRLLPQVMGPHLVYMSLQMAQWALSARSITEDVIPESDPSVQEIAARELINWALGYEDTVRMRVEGRQVH